MGTKPGVPYREIEPLIRTFDLILFRGSDFVSGAIAKIEDAYVGVRDFTHAGLAIRAKDFDRISPLWRSGDETVYIFESTASGNLVDGVPSVPDGRGHLGVQIRDLAQVVRHYDQNPSTRMAWLPLQDGIRDEAYKQLSPCIVDTIVNRYMYRAYNASCVALAGAASPLIRHIRDCWLFRKTRSIFCRYCCCGAKPNTWLFCSELCAQIYKDIGVFPESVVPADVMPVDFLPEETTPMLVPSVSDPILPIKERKTVDADHQVPWVFRTLVRFRSNPSRVIASADDLVSNPEASPL